MAEFDQARRLGASPVSFGIMESWTTLILLFSFDPIRSNLFAV